MKYFTYFIITVVTAAVIAGFFVVGSPQEQRLRRFDERRVQDLQDIQWRIVNYWQNKQALPPDLNALRDDISGFVSPVDPETSQNYTYEITGALSFRLCSTFNFSNTSGTDQSGSVSRAPIPAEPYGKPLGVVDNWSHPEGQHCYERTIDPQLYPPTQKTT